MMTFKIGAKCRVCKAGKVDREPSPFCAECRVKAKEWLKERVLKPPPVTFQREWQGEWQGE